MTATVLKLLPDDEVRIIENYIYDKWDYDLEEAYDALGVPALPTRERDAVAVAQILLNPIQGSLPNWGGFDKDGNVVLGRNPHHRHKDGRLAFNPQHVCTINWADSAPGFSWPEAYHVTFLPGFGKYIVTASRDSVAGWGCLDQAIGFGDESFTPIEIAKCVILGYWSEQWREWDQHRWEYLFSEGLIDAKTANAWADEVWCAPQADDEDELDYEETSEGESK